MIPLPVFLFLFLFILLFRFLLIYHILLLTQAAISYINQLTGTITEMEDVMIVDFGTLGLQVSIYRFRYPSLLECAAHTYTQDISGDWVDRKLIRYFAPQVLKEWQQAMEKEDHRDLVADGKKAEDTAEFKYVRDHSLLQAVHQILGQLGQSGEVSESITLVPFDAEMQISISTSQAEALVVKEMQECLKNAVHQALRIASQHLPDLNINHVRVTGGASLHPVFRRLLADLMGVESVYILCIYVYLSLFSLLILSF